MASNKEQSYSTIYNSLYVTTMYVSYTDGILSTSVPQLYPALLLITTLWDFSMYSIYIE